MVRPYSIEHRVDVGTEMRRMEGDGREVPLLKRPASRARLPPVNSKDRKSSGEAAESRTASDSSATPHEWTGEVEDLETIGFRGMARACFCNPSEGCDTILVTRLTITGALAVLITVMTLLTWYFTSTHAESSVRVVASALRHELLAQTQDTTGAILLENSLSSLSLARLLSSPLIWSNFSLFSTLESQVRPALFPIYSALPDKYQVSFFGKDGMFVSYSSEFKDTPLIFSNVSNPSPSVGKFLPSDPHMDSRTSLGDDHSSTQPLYKCYRQSADSNTGLPMGDATPFSALPYWKSNLFKRSLRTQLGTTSWGFMVSGSGDLLFLSLSPVWQSAIADPVGLAVVGVSMARINSVLTNLNLQGGDLYITTEDNKLLSQTGVSIGMNVGDLGEPILPNATNSNNSVVAGAAQFLLAKVENNLTLLSKQAFQADNVLIGGAQYTLDSAPFQMANTTLVSVMILQRKSIWGPTDSRSHVTLALLVVLAMCVGTVGCFFIVVLTKGVSNEMRLRSALLQQLEATKQAESKSSHKSMVFASMSHDLRTPLAAILGLIDLCLCDAKELSELESNLLQMKSCANNLLGILNTILDMSKIEAGKLQLEETEFDLVHVMEEVVDMFAVVGMQRGLEVVLDLPDESIHDVSRVHGDPGRVKQLLSNLLSNGVKFTSQGHVVLRAWPKRTSSVTFSPRDGGGLFGYFGKGIQNWLPGGRRSYKPIEAESDVYSAARNEVEFEFEVDDTGKGIPPDRRKAVFENFVQVDSTIPRTHGGTGLGLGIVHSLVRLMRGEISIIDKDPGEPGTCFRFNLIFPCTPEELTYKPVEPSSKQPSNIPTIMGYQAASTDAKSGDVNWKWPLERPRVVTYASGRGSSPPQVEGVHVLLAMQGQAGKTVVKRWLERRGLQVWSVSHWEDFLPMFDKIKQKVFVSGNYAPSPDRLVKAVQGGPSVSWAEGLDATQWHRGAGASRISFVSTPSLQELASDVPINSSKKTSPNAGQSRLLVLIDLAMAPDSMEELFLDLQGGLADHSDQSALVKVVWLITANTPGASLLGLKRKKGAVPCDLVLHKPLHSSRLRTLWEQVEILLDSKDMSRSTGRVSMLDLKESMAYPWQRLSSTTSSEVDTRLETQISETDIKGDTLPFVSNSPANVRSTLDGRAEQECSKEIDLNDLQRDQEDPSHAEAEALEKAPMRALSLGAIPQSSTTSVPLKRSSRESEIMGPPDSLAGMHILVAEDNHVLQKLTKTMLLRLGASVVCVDNGADAARLILSNLPQPVLSASASTSGDIPEEDYAGTVKSQPFDLVLMDCQMPRLDGYGATQLIREQERHLGWHTPVIALTAHAMAKDESKCIEAGMDFYLTKPLATRALLNVIAQIKQTW